MKIKPTKRVTWLLIRIILVIALFVWLANRIDVSSLLVQLKQVNVGVLSLIIPVWMLAFVLASWRWKLLLEPLSEGVNLAPIALLNLVGAFYSSFIPGNISGDVIKGWYLSRAHVRRVDAISSALVDRLIGFFVTVAMGLLALLVTPQVRQVLRISAVSVGLLLLVLVLAPLMGFRLLPRFRWIGERIPQSMRTLYHVGAIYSRHPRIFALSTLISLLYFFNWVIILWMISLALQIDGISIVSMALILAVVNLVQAIPISINGLGVREGALLILLPLYGVTDTKALLFSLLIAALGWTAAVIGGLIVITDTKMLRSGAPTHEGNAQRHLDEY